MSGHRFWVYRRAVHEEMDRESYRVFSLLTKEWSEVVATLQKMNPRAEVRPTDPWSAFDVMTSAAENTIRVRLNPVVFNLPERADDLNLQLYITVDGYVTFDRDLFIASGVMRTREFGTRVAYFRAMNSGLKHVFGVHYDFSRDEIGHPVFHAQMRSLSAFSGHVRELYTVGGDSLEDSIEGVLKTVRVPTAQMDMFSLFLQVCADHLLHAASGVEERDAFNAFLERSAFLQGAGFQFGRLGTDAARVCYRARHWYPY
jgi:hypothetical protein